MMGRLLGCVACPCSGSHMRLSPVTLFFLKTRELGLSWDTGLSSEQTVLQNPVTTDGVGGSGWLPFSFSFQPGFQRRHLQTCQLCTFDLDKPGALQWDFLRHLFRAKFPFHFIQSWQEQSSACLLRFSASFLLLPAKDTAPIFARC